MFDINLLSPPGIQSKSNFVSNKENKSSDKVNKSPKKNRNDFDPLNSKYILVLSVCIMVFITSYFIFFEKNDFRLDNFIQNKINNLDDIEKIILVLRNYDEDFILDYMDFSEATFDIQIRTNSSNPFYNILDKLSEIVYDDVKGHKVNNKFLISLTLPWFINNNSNFDINLINKELSDFNPQLKKEIYKDKLIIITDAMQLFDSLDFLYEINAIQDFSINIEPIESLPYTMKLYKIIVY